MMDMQSFEYDEFFPEYSVAYDLFMESSIDLSEDCYSYLQSIDLLNTDDPSQIMMTCGWDESTLSAVGDIFQAWMYDMSQFDYEDWMPEYSEASLLIDNGGIPFSQDCYNYILSIDVTNMGDYEQNEMMMTCGWDEPTMQSAGAIF
jgi:hypothetical protein